MRRAIEVPELVERKAEALGRVGRRWLRDLPSVVATIEREWDLVAGDPFDGGSTALVVPVTLADGGAAVLKISIPDGLPEQGAYAREIGTVARGQGHAYVRILRADVKARVVLYERLGRALIDVGLPVVAQIDVIAATLQHAWDAEVPSEPWRTGVDQAEWLADDVAAKWETLGHPCAEATIRRAQRAARRRADACRVERGRVLVHGDAHPSNVLEDLTEPDQTGGFKLIDPDGMVSERAHDLAIALRDWSVELLALDDPAATLADWCARMSAPSGTDPDAVWEWALLERVSTGLYLLALRHDSGHALLAVADAIASSR